MRVRDNGNRAGRSSVTGRLKTVTKQLVQATLTSHRSKTLARAVYAHSNRPAKNAAQTRDGNAEMVGYDAHARVDQLTRAACELLHRHNIPHIHAGRIGRLHPTLIIRDSAQRGSGGELKSIFAQAGWSARLARPSGAGSRRHGGASLTVSQPVQAANGRVMSTDAESIRIEAWHEVAADTQRKDGGVYEPGTVWRWSISEELFYTYLSPSEWEARECHGVDEADSGVSHHVFSVTDPVDVVYTWVDDDDPHWQERRMEAQSDDDARRNATADSASRYRNHDELRYSLRSLEYYANWVRNVFIVTDGQVPDWLNTDHPKIHVIDHKEIFRDSSVLPVFNSHAIEANLHHIDGLAEQYLYLNDDVFFMEPVEPELFFEGNGASHFWMSDKSIDVGSTTPFDTPVTAAAKNNRDLVLNRFGRLITKKLKHTPHPQLRSVMEQMEEENPEMFASVSASKFRHPGDLSIASSLYHYYAYCLGRAVPSWIRYAFVDVCDPIRDVRLSLYSRKRDLDCLCVNDLNARPEDDDAIAQGLQTFFEATFPVKSTFEQ